jgi:SpoIIAA-like
MYEILPESEGHVIALKGIGTLTETDFKMLEPHLVKRLEAAAPASVLLDWTALHGWDTQGEREAFLFWLREWDQIKRVAIICDEKFLGEMIQIKKALSRSDVRHFSPADAAKARTWVKGI